MDKKPCSIALVTNSFPKVSETFIFNKAIGLMNAGFKVTVISHGNDDDSLFFKDKKGSRGIGRLIIHRGNLKKLINSLKLLMKRPYFSFNLFSMIYTDQKDIKNSLVSFMKIQPFASNHFDIIHFEFSGIAVSYNEEFKYLVKSKIGLSCRGAAEKITPLVNLERKKQLQSVFSKASIVHCVSNNMASTCALYGLDKKKTLVNYPSINTSIFKRTKKKPEKKRNKFHILSVGRLHWKKGIPYALLSIKQLVSQYNLPIQYEIIGDGVEYEHLVYMINKLELLDYVTLSGNQPSSIVKDKMENADIFLLPSLNEGISNSAMESMSMELPIISTDVDGMSELIDDDVDGLLVSPYSSTEITSNVLKLYNDDELRKTLGENARNKITSKFNLYTQIKTFSDAYQNLSSPLK